MSREFTGSWFVSDRQIADSIESYVSGKRGTADVTHVRLWNGVTYRDYGDGTTEAAPLRGNAGGATRGDGGGSTRGDGGNGSKSFGESQVLGQVLSPGILYQDKPVIGFKLPSGAAVYADTDALELLRLQATAKDKLQPIIAGEPVKQLLLNKLLNSPSFEMRTSEKTTDEIKKDTPFQIKAAFLNRTLGTSPQMDAKAPANLPSIAIDKLGDMNFKLNGPLPSQELIEFKLDSTGHLVDPQNQTAHPRFSPIISVKGAAGGEYIIDLRRLFFVDLSTLGDSHDIPWFRLERKDNQAIAQALIKRAAAEGPVLSLRPKNSNRSFELQFTQAEIKQEPQSDCVADSLSAFEPVKSVIRQINEIRP
jgi:hypothetical protein